MTDHPVRSLHYFHRSAGWQPHRWAAVAAALCSVVLVCGCPEHKRRSVQWQMVSVVHPRPAPRRTAQVAKIEPPELEPPEPPELRIAQPASLGNFPLSANARPPRPRATTPQPANAEPGKPQSPFVAPQLSAAESNTAQQETAASLAAAEKSLAATQGKSLNAAQSDTVSKITGFMADARAAGAGGDWTSARTLARKAQLLAEELAQSLQ